MRTGDKVVASYVLRRLRACNSPSIPPCLAHTNTPHLANTSPAHTLQAISTVLEEHGAAPELIQLDLRDNTSISPAGRARLVRASPGPA